MTRIFTLLIGFVFIAQTAFSQVWLDIGPKVNYGITGFYSAEIYDDNQHKVLFKTDLAYGGKVGLYLGEVFGVSFEGMIANNRQEFEYTAGGTNSINSTKWQTLNLAIMPRFSFTGSYIELGPQWSLLRSVEQSLGGAPLDSENLYRDRYINGVFGFGGYIAGSEIFTLSMGVRFGYSLTDFLSESAQDLSNPPPAQYKTFDEYAPVNPFYVSFVAELTFGIGGVAKAECGRRSFLFGSRFK